MILTSLFGLSVRVIRLDAVTLTIHMKFEALVGTKKCQRLIYTDIAWSLTVVDIHGHDMVFNVSPTVVDIHGHDMVFSVSLTVVDIHGHDMVFSVSLTVVQPTTSNRCSPVCAAEKAMVVNRIQKLEARSLLHIC